MPHELDLAVLRRMFPEWDFVQVERPSIGLAAPDPADAASPLIEITATHRGGRYRSVRGNIFIRPGKSDNLTVARAQNLLRSMIWALEHPHAA